MLNNLGRMFQQQGSLEKARPLLERSLAIRKKPPGRPSGCRTCAEQLWILFQEQGDLTKAEPLYTRAVQIYEKYYGRNHQLYGQALNNLAVVHLVKGEYPVAGPIPRKPWPSARQRSDRRGPR